MSAELTLTARDLEIVQKVFQCFKSPDALKIDTDKLAQLAGFSNGRSANASWCVIKKKLMGTEGDASTANGDKVAATNGDEANSPAKAAKATPKRARAPKAKTPCEGEADDETTPSPKKGGRKSKTVPAAEVTAEVDDAANADEVNVDAIPTKKRRAPTKPKDPNATPATKRAKKNAKGDATVTAAAPPDDDAAEDSAAANTQLDGEAASPQTSIFGDGPNKVKTEQQAEDDEVFDAEDQAIVDEGLKDIFTQNSQTVA